MHEITHWGYWSMVEYNWNKLLVWAARFQCLAVGFQVGKVTCSVSLFAQRDGMQTLFPPVHPWARWRNEMSSVRQSAWEAECLSAQSASGSGWINAETTTKSSLQGARLAHSISLCLPPSETYWVFNQLNRIYSKQTQCLAQRFSSPLHITCPASYSWTTIVSVQRAHTSFSLHLTPWSQSQVPSPLSQIVLLLFHLNLQNLGK